MPHLRHLGGMLVIVLYCYPYSCMEYQLLAMTFQKEAQSQYKGIDTALFTCSVVVDP